MSGGDAGMSGSGGADEGLVASWVDRLTDASADLARSTLLTLRSTYPRPEEFIDTVMVPCQEEIGRRWIRGTVTATMEHRVTASFERVVLESMPSGNAATLPATLATFAVQGDHHSLGALAVAWLVAASGRTVDYLGAGVPVGDLETQLERHSYRAVAVGCTTSAHLVGAYRTLNALRAHGCRVVAGGGGFGPGGEYALQLGADQIALTVEDGRRLLSMPVDRSSEPSVDPVRAEQAVLVDAEATWIARDVIDRLRGLTDLSLAPSGLPELTTVSVRATAGALMLDRSEIVEAHTRWLAELLSVRAGLGWLAPVAMGLVADAVAAHAPLVRTLRRSAG